MRLALGIAIAVLAVAVTAAADPLRLRADALATTTSPAGLARARGRRSDAAGAVRRGRGVDGRRDRTPGEDVERRRPRDRGPRAHARTRGSARELGRFVSTLGALRPVHVDGGRSASGCRRSSTSRRSPGSRCCRAWATNRAWDWVVGRARVAAVRRLRLGRPRVRRSAATTASSRPRSSASTRGADDRRRAPTSARAWRTTSRTPGSPRSGSPRAIATARSRTELYARHRAASHLLPATSLFSVIGDVPAQRAGCVVTWRAAPRLDVIARRRGARGSTRSSARSWSDEPGFGSTSAARAR